ncbi:hypothetical protein B0H19DRAFT_1066200 [Mycena capillaripes]|nr:hypothetical protein B0H19DRAFT_1066200 [Mycena capillaripes]
MSIELPQELIEQILDHLADDIGTLRACTLMGRAWVYPSRSYLFKTCRLNPDNILVFCELLRSPHSCIFLPHIRSITAFRNYWHPNDGWFDEIAAHLYNNLTCVRTLEMKLNFIKAGPFFQTGFVAAFPKVTRLVLTCDFGSLQPAPLIDMICLFHALQELDIRELTHYSVQRISDPSASAVPPRGLHTLKLSLHSTRPILAWLHASSHLPSVNSVTLPPMLLRGHDQVNAMRAALQQLGDALHDFDITPCANQAGTVFDLSLHPNLRTLAVRDFELTDSFTNPFLSTNEALALDPKTILLLIKGASPTLEHFCLSPAKSMYQNFEWATLDAVLYSATRFPLLRSVVLTCTDTDCDFLREELPLLGAAKVLKFKTKA